MMKRFMPWAAVILFIASGLIWLHNGSVARSKVAQLQQVDATGEDVQPQMTDLSDYVHNHMGASIMFTRTAAYNRASDAAKAAAAAANTSNQKIYAEAQAACSGHSDSITQAKCNQDYLAKHLVNLPQPSPVATPKVADYTYHFTSPVWTPDLAGALLLGAILLGVVALIGMIKDRG